MNSCVECGDVITNPIGEERLAAEFRTWLAETDGRLEKKFSDEYVSKKHFVAEDNETTCIFGHERMDLCSYCVAAQLIEWLDNEQVSPEVMGRALGFFLAGRDGPFVMRGLKERKRGLKIMLTPNIMGSSVMAKAS